MYINKLLIDNFRVFSGETPFAFKFSKNLNCISGHNGIGKSTILAILSNCGELKIKDGVQLNGNQFRGEYSLVIKGDKRYDKIGKICTLFFDDLPPSNDPENPYESKLSYRATFQNVKVKNTTYKPVEKEKTLFKKEVKEEETTRYRLLPIKTERRKTEKKLKFPIIYLGLSRLFPIGESELSSKNNIIFDQTELREIHKRILSSKDEYIESTQVKISDTNKKQGFGVETESYSYLSNSSGQDNVGQILLAVYSYQRLKEQYQDYNGGLLLIDEIDATLHPSAQNKLIDFLLLKSEELDLQIFFTTHSNSLLEHLNFLRRSPSKKNKIKVNYLNNSGHILKNIENPTNDFLRNNLHETYTHFNFEEKVSIFVEDEVAKWFINKLITHFKFPKIKNIQYTESSVSWTQIINIFKDNYHIFKHSIVILDPDLSKSDNFNQLKKKLAGTIFHDKVNTNGGNIFYMELDDYLEKIMWEYMKNIQDDHNVFLLRDLFESNFTKKTLIANGPFSTKYDDCKTEKIKIKQWFEENFYYVNIFVDYWFIDNKDIAKEFYLMISNTIIDKLSGSS